MFSAKFAWPANTGHSSEPGPDWLTCGLYLPHQAAASQVCFPWCLTSASLPHRYSMSTFSTHILLHLSLVKRTETEKKMFVLKGKEDSVGKDTGYRGWWLTLHAQIPPGGKRNRNHLLFYSIIYIHYIFDVWEPHMRCGMPSSPNPHTWTKTKKKKKWSVKLQNKRQRRVLGARLALGQTVI